MKNFVGFVVLLSMLVGCSGKVSKVLAYSEESIDENPVSVLDTLNTISGRKLRGDNAARYALLRSAALDKNHLPSESDSLISIAVRWYQMHPDPIKRMKSLLYLGKVQQAENRLASAITTFTQAYEAGLETGDHYYLGMIQRGIAQSYASAYMRTKAIDHMNLAYQEFCEAGKQSHADWALCNLSNYYLNIKDRHSCDSLVSIVEKRARQSGDISLLSNILRVHAYSSIEEEDGHSVIRTYKAISDTLGFPLTVRDYAMISRAYELVGDSHSSDSLMSIANTQAADQLTKGIIAFDKQHIAKLRGDYKAAYDYLDRAVAAEDSLVNVILEQSVESAQTEFFRDRLEESELLLGRRTAWVLIFSILSLFAITMLVRAIHSNRTQKRETEEAINGLKDNLDKIKSREETLSEGVYHLFERRLATLNSLSEAFFYEGHQDSSAKRVYRKVEDELDSFRKEGSLQEIEKIVNGSQDGIMTKLREEINLPEKDYQLCCYFIAGLNPSSIRLLTDEGKSNIYSRKSRIKQKIKESNSPNAPLFLDRIG
ncbi:MAG: hypothetical protein IKS22_04125 [Bacteroidales bacterium]|nr:hypothetical protein [Bacteroidales bacterium]